MDRRVRKTQIALVEAVRCLLRTYVWDDISIQLICDTADISRSTFYAHFADKQDILDLVFRTLKLKLDEKNPTRGLNRNLKFRFLPPLVSHMKSHLPLFEKNRSTVLSFKMFTQFKKAVFELANDEISASKFESKFGDDQIVYVVGGIFASLEVWCESGCEVEEKIVLEKLDRMILAALHS